MASVEIISGSQVDAFARCRRRYFYAHDLNLTLKEVTPGIATGRAGHALLRSYFNALLAGVGHRDACEHARESAGWDIEIGEKLSADTQQHALALVELYWAAYAEDGRRYEVVAVEQTYQVPMGAVVYAFTVDLLARDRATGQLGIMDHRFLRDFYSSETVAVDPQLPRYAIGLRMLDRTPAWAYRNMVSNRPRKNPTAAAVVRRLPVTVNEQRLATAGPELEARFGEMLAWRQQPLPVRQAMAVRTWDWMSCARCPFLAPCAASAKGEDTTLMLVTDYEQSTYGYTLEK